MQNTRLNQLVERAWTQVEQWRQLSWRQVASLLISVLLGNACGVALTTTAGQLGAWDPVAAACTFLVTEGLSWLVYRQTVGQAQALFVPVVNGYKISFTYSLFVEALKLSS